MTWYVRQKESDHWLQLTSQITAQLIPASEPLLANMPTGRKVHTPRPFIPAELDASTLGSMRAQLDSAALARTMAGAEEDSGEEETDIAPPGAFPGASGSQTSTYY